VRWLTAHWVHPEPMATDRRQAYPADHFFQGDRLQPRKQGPMTQPPHLWLAEQLEIQNYTVTDKLSAKPCW